MLLRAKGRAAIRRLSDFSSRSDDQRRPPKKASPLSSGLDKGKDPDGNDDLLLYFEEKTVERPISSATTPRIRGGGDDRELAPNNEEGSVRRTCAGGTDARAVNAVTDDDRYDDDSDDGFDDFNDSDVEGEEEQPPLSASAIISSTTPPLGVVAVTNVGLSAAADASPRREEKDISSRETSTSLPTELPPTGAVGDTAPIASTLIEVDASETATQGELLTGTTDAVEAVTPIVPTTIAAEMLEITAQGEQLLTGVATEGVFHQLPASAAASPLPQTDATTTTATPIPSTTATTAAATPSARSPPGADVQQHCDCDEETATKATEDKSDGLSPGQEKDRRNSRSQITEVVDKAGASRKVSGGGGGGRKGRKGVVPVSARR